MNFPRATKACRGCDVREENPANEFALCDVCIRNGWTVLRMQGDRLAKEIRELRSKDAL